MSTLKSDTRLLELAREIVTDKSSPPVLLLAAVKAIWHIDYEPLRDLVRRAAQPVTEETGKHKKGGGR